MIDPVIEDAVNGVNDCVKRLRQALERHGTAGGEVRGAEEAVCLAVRYALALFLPAWVESGCEYDRSLTKRLREYVDAAATALPEDTPYYRSVSERKEELEDFVTGKKKSLV